MHTIPSKVSILFSVYLLSSDDGPTGVRDVHTVAVFSFRLPVLAAPIDGYEFVSFGERSVRHVSRVHGDNPRPVTDLPISPSRASKTVPLKGFGPPIAHGSVAARHPA